jgi:uncharacterized membrane-anchored protein YhcB (DUF1043 family)
MKKREANYIFVIISSIYFFTFVGPSMLLAELSVDVYCQLSIRNLSIQIPQTQELISIVEQNFKNPVEMDLQLENKRKQFDQVKFDLYASFNTTAQEYLAYMDHNAKTIKGYLDANPSIKQQIEDLSAQLKVLTDRENELMQAQSHLEDPPPTAD